MQKQKRTQREYVLRCIDVRNVVKKCQIFPFHFCQVLATHVDRAQIRWIFHTAMFHLKPSIKPALHCRDVLKVVHLKYILKIQWQTPDSSLRREMFASAHQEETIQCFVLFSIWRTNNCWSHNFRARFFSLPSFLADLRESPGFFGGGQNRPESSSIFNFSGIKPSATFKRNWVEQLGCIHAHRPAMDEKNIHMHLCIPQILGTGSKDLVVILTELEKLRQRMGFCKISTWQALICHLNSKFFYVARLRVLLVDLDESRTFGKDLGQLQVRLGNKFQGTRQEI